MQEILRDSLPLIGVLIGGLITFFIQQSSIRKQHRWERKKIELDNYYKEETQKFNVLNKILKIDGTCLILEINMHDGPELNTKQYNEHIRPLLFEIFHLLDEDIAKEVNNIEEIYERQYVMEEEDEGDKEALSKYYIKIIQLIKKQFNEYRKSKEKIRGA